MKLGIYSDFHITSLQQSNKSIKRLIDNYNFASADVILFCGDIATINCIERFLKEVREVTMKPIVMCYGNHEFYNTRLNVEETTIKLNSILDEYDIDHEPVVINNKLFVPSTLFPEYSDNEFDKFLLRNKINDFRYIKDHTIDKMNDYHVNDKKFIYDAVRTSNIPVVMLTHFPPLSLHKHPRYPDSFATKYFYNNFVLNKYCKENIKLWAYGHDHWATDFYHEGIRFVSNPIGYTGEDCNQFDSFFKFFIED